MSRTKKPESIAKQPLEEITSEPETIEWSATSKETKTSED